MEFTAEQWSGVEGDWMGTIKVWGGVSSSLHTGKDPVPSAHASLDDWRTGPRNIEAVYERYNVPAPKL